MSRIGTGNFLYERAEAGQRALLVHVAMRSAEAREDLAELRELVASAGATEVGLVVATREAPDPRFFIGSGKADEVRAAVETLGCDVVLFNTALSPAQERNLERHLQCRVLDRTGLILDIFAQRAQTFEGKLQVELAQLRHLSTRLVRGWTHLERQKGGIGLRGPGEKQLETDRRLLGLRIRQISTELERVRQRRGENRRARRKAELPVVSLVGYTNAGKSTLFNRLTGAGVLVEDALFATLDPTLRRLDLPGGVAVVLADTVGFIRHLPHDLVAAFRSTLEETLEAELLLHVIDAADPEREEKVEQVNAVLAEIGAQEVPQVQVYNKADLLPERPDGDARQSGEAAGRVFLSAATGEGVDDLLRLLQHHFKGDDVHRWLRLPVSAGRLRSRLFEAGSVLSEAASEEGWLLEVRMSRQRLASLCRGEGLPETSVAGGSLAP